MGLIQNIIIDLTEPFRLSHPVSQNSVVLVVGSFEDARVLHIQPEDLVIERINYNRPGATKFTYAAKELSREQIATVALPTTSNVAGDNDKSRDILQDIGERAVKALLSASVDTKVQGRSVEEIHEALRATTVAVLEEMKSRTPYSDSSTPLLPVFLVRIWRKKPGRLIGDHCFTSIAP